MIAVKRDVKFDEKAAMRCSLDRGSFSCSLIMIFWLERKNSRSCGPATSRGAESGDIHSRRDIQRRKEANQGS